MLLAVQGQLGTIALIDRLKDAQFAIKPQRLTRHSELHLSGGLRGLLGGEGADARAAQRVIFLVDRHDDTELARAQRLKAEVDRRRIFAARQAKLNAALADDLAV